MFGLGTWEMVIFMIIVLVIFGPKSLPKIGQALGKGIREFRDATKGLTADLEDDQPRRSRPSVPQQQTIHDGQPVDTFKSESETASTSSPNPTHQA